MKLRDQVIGLGVSAAGMAGLVDKAGTNIVQATAVAASSLRGPAQARVDAVSVLRTRSLA